MFLQEKLKASEDKPFPTKGFGSSHGTGYSAMKRWTPFTRHNNKHIWNEGFNVFWPEKQFAGRLEQIADQIWPVKSGKTSREQGQLFR
jgi:hypothetical protein